MDGCVFECNVLFGTDVSTVGYCTVVKASGIFPTSETPFSTQLGVERHGSKQKSVKSPDVFEMRSQR